MNNLALILQQSPDPEAMKHIFAAMLAIIPIIILIAIAIVMVPFWFILKKAGFTPWLSLVCLIPSLPAPELRFY
jgi:predicted ABC-type sugar transport system permease subunit